MGEFVTVTVIDRVNDTTSSVAKAATKSAKPAATGMAAMVDPMQLWGSLTQQFQQIAAGALREATKNTAIDASKNMAAGLAKEAVKAGKKLATGGAARRPAAKKPARKAAARGA